MHFLIIKQAAWLRLLILLSIGSGMLSCGPKSTNAENKEASTTTMAALPNKLATKEVQKLVGNFKQSQGNLDDDFYFNAGSGDRVFAFKLDEKQDQAFFEELAAVRASIRTTTASVALRVLMSLRKESKSLSTPDSPNFEPLLQLIVIADSTENSYTADARGTYPLRPFKPVLDSINLRTISSGKAGSLISNWVKLKKETIDQQLYRINEKRDSSNRIQYYTFGAADTEAIYGRYKAQPTNARQPFPNFFLYLGVHDDEDQAEIPLCVVLEVSAKDKPYFEYETLDEDSTYFEFARPCPKYCNET